MGPASRNVASTRIGHHGHGAGERRPTEPDKSMDASLSAPEESRRSAWNIPRAAPSRPDNREKNNVTTRQGRRVGIGATWKGMPGPRQWRDPGGSCGFVDEPFGPARALSGRVDKPWTTPGRRPPHCPHSRASRPQAPQDGNNNPFFIWILGRGRRTGKSA